MRPSRTSPPTGAVRSDDGRAHARGEGAGDAGRQGSRGHRARPGDHERPGEDSGDGADRRAGAGAGAWPAPRSSRSGGSPTSTRTGWRRLSQAPSPERSRRTPGSSAARRSASYGPCRARARGARRGSGVGYGPRRPPRRGQQGDPLVRADGRTVFFGGFEQAPACINVLDVGAGALDRPRGQQRGAPRRDRAPEVDDDGGVLRRVRALRAGRGSAQTSSTERGRAPRASARALVGQPTSSARGMRAASSRPFATGSRGRARRGRRAPAR